MDMAVYSKTMHRVIVLILVFLSVHQPAEGDVALSMKENFANLLRAHYVERSPAPEPSLHGKGPVEPPKKVARGGVVSNYTPYFLFTR
jgi:hypothetical protein